MEGIAETEMQVASIQSLPVHSSSTISDLLTSPACSSATVQPFLQEQLRDPDLVSMVQYLEKGELPADPELSRRLILNSTLFTVLDNTLYMTHRDGGVRAVVPTHLRRQLMDDYHRGPSGSHYSADKLFRTISHHWWWQGMRRDIVQFTRNCPECTIVSGGGKTVYPPLHPIEVQRPFQIIGIDIMDLPVTKQGNRHVLVFQDHFTKWPMVYAVPDQKSQRIVRILCEEIVPMFGIPEALLSDRGANLLSHLMQDVCKLLGIKKLNTTSYHPQCNGMVERLNRTLKTMLRKHAARFGLQWDTYLPGVLWAYRNSPHESTGEKPSFLLFGMDLRMPSQAALLPPSPADPTTIEEYRHGLLVSLSSARELAASTLKRAQQKSKQRYDTCAVSREFKHGDWVLVRFPSDKTGRNRKLSRPWHGPYRVLQQTDTNLTVDKVYRSKNNPIRIHHSRVKFCPPDLPPGFYWYGHGHFSPGKVPSWVDNLLGEGHQNTATPTAEPPADIAIEPEEPPAGIASLMSGQDILPPQGVSATTLQDKTTSRNDVVAADQAHITAEMTAHLACTGTEQFKGRNNRQTGKYHLRDRILPPDRFALSQARGRASPGAGVM